MEEVWISGRVVAATDKGQVWELQGIFPDEPAAVAACRDWTYFVAPILWNVSLRHETIDEPRAYYPIARQPGDELP